jgi:hypothetical protein
MPSHAPHVSVTSSHERMPFSQGGLFACSSVPSKQEIGEVPASQGQPSAGAPVQAGPPSPSPPVCDVAPQRNNRNFADFAST